MINTRRSALKILTLGLFWVPLLACQNNASRDTSDPSVTTFYLVRHAEKILNEKDPALTKAGTERAHALAERLSEIKLTQIYSTDTKRTRDTAKPTAKAQGLEITLYDGSDLNAFANSLDTARGHILIVGHSNTTPDLVGALGGVPGDPIIEATEYDRFYRVSRVRSGTGYSVTTKLERFGTPSPLK